MDRTDLTIVTLDAREVGIAIDKLAKPPGMRLQTIRVVDPEGKGWSVKLHYVNDAEWTEPQDGGDFAVARLPRR